VVLIELVQAALITAVAFGLGWTPHTSALAFLTVPLLVLAGTAAFSGLALLMAGTLRAEATLALANLIYIALLGLGGVVFPLTKFPAAAHPYLTLLPAGALATGLRSVLAHSAGVPVRDLIVLVVWAAVGIGLAARTFRWE
jgi:ABC-2 type transport system permease protein